MSKVKEFIDELVKYIEDEIFTSVIYELDNKYNVCEKCKLLYEKNSIHVCKEVNK